MSKRSQDAPARIKWGSEELAVRWGIPKSRVLHWILTGQLRAVDVSERPGGDPDYRVDIVDLMLFEQEREIHAGSARRSPMNLNIDPNEFAPIIEQVVDAAIARLHAERVENAKLPNLLCNAVAVNETEADEA